MLNDVLFLILQVVEQTNTLMELTGQINVLGVALIILAYVQSL